MGQCWGWNKMASVWEGRELTFLMVAALISGVMRRLHFPKGRSLQVTSEDVSQHEVTKSHSYLPVTFTVDTPGLGTLFPSSGFWNLVVTATEGITGRCGFFSPHFLGQSVHRLYLITYWNSLPEPDGKPCLLCGIRKKQNPDSPKSPRTILLLSLYKRLPPYLGVIVRKHAFAFDFKLPS